MRAAGAVRSNSARVAIGLALAAASVALHELLSPVLGLDSYQTLLAAVAVSSMVAGFRAGMSALCLAGAFKLLVFLPRESSLHLYDARLLIRFALFLCLGLLICLLGLKLQQSQKKVRVLSGLLPICAWCKRIRDEQDHWQQMEQYIHEHSEANFTHGMCPDCARKLAN